MKTTLSEREGNTVKLAVEVSGEELQEAFDSRLKKLAKEVRIPGFRPGKVPLTMLQAARGRSGHPGRRRRRRHGPLVRARRPWSWASTSVDTPQIDVGDELPELGKTFSFTASVTVMPEVELGQYKGVEVPKEADEVTTEEVDAQMDRLRNEFAELKPVEGRAVQNGDFVTADFRAEVEGRACRGARGRRLRVRGGRGPHLRRGGEGRRRHERGRDQDVPAAAAGGLPRRTGRQDRRLHRHREGDQREGPASAHRRSGPPRSASSRPCSSCARRSGARCRPARPTPPTRSSAPWPSRPPPTTPSSTCPTWW